MELAVTSARREQPLARWARVDRQAVGAWLLGFAPVVYLALRGGGYDLVVRSEVGLAVWWVLLLGAVAGLLPVGRIGRLGWVCVGLLGAFAIWTALAIAWSESVELTVNELGRVATYLGFLLLGLCVIRRHTLRALISGLAVAFGCVALLAVLSRMYPNSFPHDQLASFFPGTTRLDYPFNYANGTGEFLAMGIPLLVVVAARARTTAGQALAAAAIPLLALALLMTASRSAVLTAVVAVVVLVALVPRRLAVLLSSVAPAAGSVVLILGLLHRSAVRHDLHTAVAVSQRHQLALLALVTCAGVALLQSAVALTLRYGLPVGSLELRRRTATWMAGVTAVILIAVAIAVGLPGKLSHEWSVFKQVNATTTGDVSRLGTVAGSHRYQYWQAAVHAFQSKPLDGIGPGTFQFYWNQHAPIHESIQNAHSLYLETLAETGLVGGILIVALLLTVLIAGIVRSLRAPPLTRALLAAATATFAAFCTAAAFDWVWQLPAIPLAALLAATAIVVPARHRRLRARRPAALMGRRGAWAVCAVAAIVAIAIPLAATSAIRSSQAQARAGHLKAALSDAETAQRLEPYAATPRLQRALLLEQLGQLTAARQAIAQATIREPNSYQLWLIRARIDAEAGHAATAVADYRHAHMLDPLDPATALNA